MQYVNIGGSVRPFKFGFNAIDIFCHERALTLAQFTACIEKLSNGNGSPGELRDIIYAGLAGGALTNGIPVSFTNTEVGDWMDELPAEELKKTMDAVAESLATPVKKKEKGIGAKP